MTRRAVILSSARTGSTWLGESLSQHPGVTYDQEALLDYSKQSGYTTDGAKEIVRDRVAACRTPVHLWKLQAWQSALFPGFVETLEAERFIFLRRENLFEWYVSNQVAMTRRVYAKRLGDVIPEVEPFRVEPKKIERAMRTEKAWWDKVRSLFSHRQDCVEITYDDLVNSYDDTIRRLFKFMDLTPRPVFSPTMKMQERNPRIQVTNFYELQEHFVGSPFYCYGFR